MIHDHHHHFHDSRFGDFYLICDRVRHAYHMQIDPYMDLEEILYRMMSLMVQLDDKYNEIIGYYNESLPIIEEIKQQYEEVKPLIDKIINELQRFDPSDYYNKIQIDNFLATKADKITLGDFLKKENVVGTIVNDASKVNNAKVIYDLNDRVDNAYVAITELEHYMDANKVKKVVIIGDSYTEDDDTPSSTATMNQKASQYGVQIVNSQRVTGTGFANGSWCNMLDTSYNQVDHEVAKEVSYVVIIGGHNDPWNIGKGTAGWTENSCKTNIERFVQKAKVDYPNAEILFYMVGNSFQGDISTFNYVGNRHAFKYWVDCVKDIKVIPNSWTSLISQYLFHDTLHPNPVGLQFMYDDIFGSISKDGSPINHNFVCVNESLIENARVIKYSENVGFDYIAEKIDGNHGVVSFNSYKSTNLNLQTIDGLSAGSYKLAGFKTDANGLMFTPTWNNGTVTIPCIFHCSDGDVSAPVTVFCDPDGIYANFGVSKSTGLLTDKYINTFEFGFGEIHYNLFDCIYKPVEEV